jgi:hypothetical protein
MTERNELDASGPGLSMGRRGQNRNERNESRRPYADIENLYEIPPVRADDPPLRDWWIDDEFTDHQHRKR